MKAQVDISAWEKQYCAELAGRELSDWQELNLGDLANDLGLLLENMMLPRLQWSEMAQLGRHMRQLANLDAGG